MSELSFTSENFSKPVDNNILSSHPEKVEDSTPWGGVTNPKLHCQDNYRYLVHAINPTTDFMRLVCLTVMIEDPNSINKEDGDQTIDLSNQPERIAERVALSCSLIDQAHTGTWRPVGLIIQAPENNVIITQPEDAGSIIMSKKNLLRQAKEKTKSTAEELLKDSDPQRYNEVVVLANENNQKVTLAGFFYKITDSGLILDESLYRKMCIHAQRLQLPLVPIIELNIYAENKIFHNKDRFSVQYNGKLYNLIYSDKAEFTNIDYQKGQSFTPPDELEQVFDFLQKSNISQTEIDDLRSQYNKIEQPKKVNIFEERKTERMINPFLMKKFDSFDPNGPNLFSPAKTEPIIDEIVNNTPDSKKKTIKQWWKSIKLNLIKQWNFSRNKKSSN